MSSLRPPPPPSTLTSTTSPSASAPNRPIKVKLPPSLAKVTVNRQTSNSSSSSSLSPPSQIHIRRPTLVPQTPSKPQLQQQQSQSQTQIPFDAQTAKAQVNDRAVRKIMDLEIANDSLLAVNTTLENTIREQALNLEQMRKLVGVLKRKLPDSVIDQDLDSVDSMDDDLSVSGATDTANTSAFGSPAGGKRSKTFVDPFNNTLIEEIGERDSAEDQKEVEIQFNRVCATIAQLIHDGTRALTKPTPTTRLLSESKENNTPDTRTILDPPSLLSSTSPAPTITLSSSPTKQITAKSTLTPLPPSDFPLIPVQTSPSTSPTTPLPAQTVTLYKKAQLLLSSRRKYTNTTSTSTTLPLSPFTSETIEIPTPLYEALKELVEGVHEDLIGADISPSSPRPQPPPSHTIEPGGFTIGIPTNPTRKPVLVGGTSGRSSPVKDPPPPTSTTKPIPAKPLAEPQQEVLAQWTVKPDPSPPPPPPKRTTTTSTRPLLSASPGAVAAERRVFSTVGRNSPPPSTTTPPRSTTQRGSSGLRKTVGSG